MAERLGFIFFELAPCTVYADDAVTSAPCARAVSRAIMRPIPDPAERWACRGEHAARPRPMVGYVLEGKWLDNRTGSTHTQGVVDRLLMGFKSRYFGGN